MPTEREQRRDQGLALQDRLVEQLLTTSRPLSAQDWERPTNCPPWTVKMLVGHLARAGETFFTMVERGLRDDTAILQSSVDERERREREIAAMEPRAILDLLQENQDRLRAKLASLNDDQLGKLCPHTRGLQPAWWFVDQRLAELAFHGWDLNLSLECEQEVDGAAAQYLLPTLLTRNIGTWYRNGPGGDGRWLISANDIQGGSWLVLPGQGDVSVTQGAADADVTIEGDSPALIRWLYGRADIHELDNAERIKVGGQRDRIGEWRRMFPSP